MKRLIIVGAGGLGREVYQWVKHIQYVSHSWDSVAFLDDNLHALDDHNLAHKMAGTIKDYFPSDNEFFICAIGDSKIRLNISNNLRNKGAKFTNIIHPTVITADNCALGEGVILCPRAVVSSDVRIGDFVVINYLSTIGHDAVLEDGCTLSAHCDVMGFAHLEEGAFLGGGARVLPGIRVGKLAKIGAGTIAVSSVEEGISVFGNPARRVSFPR